MACRAHAREGHPPRAEIHIVFKKQSKAGRTLLAALFIAMWVIASTKPEGGNVDGTTGTTGVPPVGVCGTGTTGILPVGNAPTGTTGVPPVGNGTTGTTGVSPVASYTYSPAGDLTAKHTYTNGTDIITETYAYDLFGNRIATTDALGNTTYRTYDPLGHLTTEWGATYPVRYTYDTAGRRTSLTAFRTTGGRPSSAAVGDMTTCAYNPRTSLFDS